MSTNERAALSVAEFQTRFGVSRTSVYKYFRTGALKAIKAGRRTLIPTEAVDAWLTSWPAYIPGQSFPGRAA
jgi:excisionase family DNA binding protein